MPDKKHILSSIAAIARKLQRTPSLLEFVARSGISRSSVERSFPRWNDAVRACGLEPNRLHVRPDDAELLKDWGQAVRQRHAIPTKGAYRRLGNHDPRTVEERFGDWSLLPRAFCKFAEGKPEWADVVALASSIPPKKVQHDPLQDRATYGNPMRLSDFRHEPVNEQGVILLFGMVAKELGYMIEAVQAGFPDCEAKRQIGPERWQRVQIEFEFESRNFRDHGHSPAGCDVIVCWRHNWDECPAQIEVLELASAIASLPHTAD